MSNRSENSQKVELADLAVGQTSENSFEESIGTESLSAQPDFGVKEGARWVLPSSPWLNDGLHEERAEFEEMVELEGEERNLVSAAGAAEGEMLFEGAEEEFHTHEHSESDEEEHDKHEGLAPTSGEGENSVPQGDLLPNEQEFSLPSDSVPALSVPESGASQSNVSTIGEGDTSSPQVSPSADSGGDLTVSDPLASPLSTSSPSITDQSSLSDTKLLDLQPTSPQDSNLGHSDSGSMSTDSGSMSTDSGSMSTDSGSMSTDSGSMSTDSGSMSTDSGSMSTDSGSMSTDSGSMSTDSTLGDPGSNPTDLSMIEPIDHGQMSLF